MPQLLVIILITLGVERFHTGGAGCDKHSCGDAADEDEETAQHHVHPTAEYV